MGEDIEFKNSISIEEFCKLRESVGFQMLNIEQVEKVILNTSVVKCYRREKYEID